MKLIFKEEQEEKKILEALEYDECVIEYLDSDGDVEKILIAKDDNLENLIIFWRTSIYVYPVSDRSSMEEAYERIEEDYAIRKIVDIYPVSPSVVFERTKK